MFVDFEGMFTIIVIISSFISRVLLIGFGEIIELLHQINREQKIPHAQLQGLIEHNGRTVKEQGKPKLERSSNSVEIEYHGDKKMESRKDREQ